MKVSVIITCYNKEPYLEEAVLSAINQTYKDIEIIFIDDCSTDNSIEKIKALKQKYPQIVIIQNEENKGVVYSRNRAIEESSGEYILPLDADDIIDATYVEKAVKILDDNPDIGIVYCKAMLFGAINGEWLLNEYSDDIIFNNCIFCTALFRKSDFERFGKYKEYMNEGWEDYDLWLSFIENGVKVYRINEILFKYRQTEESRTSSANAKDIKLRRLLIKKHVDLYVNNDEFMNRVFYLNATEKINHLTQKVNKYKKRTKIISIVAISEFVILIYIAIILIRFFIH